MGTGGQLENSLREAERLSPKLRRSCHTSRRNSPPLNTNSSSLQAMPGETSTSTPPKLSVKSEPDTTLRLRSKELPENKLSNWSQRLSNLSLISPMLRQAEKHKPVVSRMKPTSMLCHSTQQRDHQPSQKKRPPLKVMMLLLLKLNEHYESAYKG